MTDVTDWLRTDPTVTPEGDQAPESFYCGSTTA